MAKFSQRIAILGIAFGVLGLSPAAQASLTLTLSDGIAGDTVIFHDTDAGQIAGNITFGPKQVGIFLISGSADAPPTIGDSTASQITTTQATLNIATTGTLGNPVTGPGSTLTVTEYSTPDDFTPVGTAGSLKADFAPTKLTGGSGTYSSTVAGSYSASASGASPVTGTGDFVATTLFDTPMSGPFSITSVLTFTPGVVGDSTKDSFTTTLTATPEPATLAMAFSALPLVGFAAWRKRRQSA